MAVPVEEPAVTGMSQPLRTPRLISADVSAAAVQEMTKPVSDAYLSALIVMVVPAVTVRPTGAANVMLAVFWQATGLNAAPWG